MPAAHEPARRRRRGAALAASLIVAAALTAALLTSQIMTSGSGARRGAAAYGLVAARDLRLAGARHAPRESTASRRAPAASSVDSFAAVDRSQLLPPAARAPASVAAVGGGGGDGGETRGDSSTASAAAAPSNSQQLGDGPGRTPSRVYFFAIITPPLSFRRRSIIRRTWLHCLAQSAAGGSGANRLELRYRFFVGRASPEARRQALPSVASDRLAREMARHGDVVPLLADDRYENLTLKCQLALQWVAREWAAASGDALRAAPPLPLGALPPEWAADGRARLVDWAAATPQRLAGASGAVLEHVDDELAGSLQMAVARRSGRVGGEGGAGAGGAARPWAAPFAGLPFGGGGGGAQLEYVVKVDADVHFCPGHIFRYGAALLARGLDWRVSDMPPVLTEAQAASLYPRVGRQPQYVWAGRGPYGNKSRISDARNHFHIPPHVYPGALDPQFLPGPTYMLSGDLLLALAGTFPVAPQPVLDGWRGFEDKYLAMLVEQLRVARGLPVRLVGRGEHYLDAATSQRLKRPFCEAGWVTKLAAQIIGYNESLPLTQFECPGWVWPLEDEQYDD